ncbi:MAG: alpha-L-fucosidase, partial [Rikenellaceae bacterium]
MKIIIRGLLSVVAAIISLHGVAQEYEPTWESLQTYEVPDWWRNSKFGIYFHWGPYSVPAHDTEWYSIW